MYLGNLSKYKYAATVQLYLTIDKSPLNKTKLNFKYKNKVGISFEKILDNRKLVLITNV